MPRNTPESRSVWIKARVRPDEMALIEKLAAGCNKTVSEFIRDAALVVSQPSGGLSPIDRHDLSRIALALKQGGRSASVLDDLQSLIRRIDDGLK